MKGWTFKREAQWMMWIALAAPGLLLFYAIVVPWIRRVTGW